MTNEWKPLNSIGEVAEAVAARMEIEFLHEAGEVAGWVRWDGTPWSTTMRYRARSRKQKVETFDDQLDAARYRWLKAKRETLLITGLFGNGCINKTVADVEAVIDQEIGVIKQPAKVMVKSICWRSTVSGSLIWYLENRKPSHEQWQRFPSGDISGEVEA